MKNKLGQVTIFVIIAIVLVALVAVYFLVFNKSASLPFEGSDEIHSFVQDCIEGIGEESIYSIGRSGGYFFSPLESTSSGIPYYYFEGKDLMPSIEEIEEEISKDFNLKLSLCTNNFEDFGEFEIETNEIFSEVKIESEKVFIDVVYPIRIMKGEEEIILRGFGVSDFSVSFLEIYNSVQEIVGDFEISSELCLSCLTEIALKKDLKIDIENPYDDTLIFVIKDENTFLGDYPFEFSFAVENV
jgi:hypothetical protein